MYGIVPTSPSFRVSGSASRVSDSTAVGLRLDRLSGQAEVEHLGLEGAGTIPHRLREHDVAGLQITMHDAGLVGRHQRIGDVRREAKGFRKGETAVDPLTGASRSRGSRGLRRCPGEPRRERLPVEMFHDQKVGTTVAPDVEQRADVRVGQGGDGPCFALEAGPAIRIGGVLRPQHLDRNDAPQTRILCLIDFPHTARAQGAKNLIRAESGTGR